MSGPLRRGLIVLALGTAVVALYVFSFVFAQATPDPHEVPVAVAGPHAGTRAAALRAERADGEALDVRRYRGPGEARRHLREGDVYAAVVITPNRKARLLTAPALGVQAATEAESRLPKAAGVKVAAPEQIRPLVRKDKAGTALNIVILPLVLVGMLIPMLLTFAVPELRVRHRLGVVLAFAICAGPASMLVAHTGLSALPGSFAAQSAVAGLLVLGVAAVVSACIALFGPAGAGVGFLLFLVVGNVASGAQIQNELLPGFWRAVGPWLPPGAATDALRSIGYFGGSDLARPLAVLIGFSVVGLIGGLVLGDRKPAAKGVPHGPTADAG